jgi:NAD(P)-dependent dehydrogenase (short-subunit alcohol dehydrogenase family)
VAITGRNPGSLEAVRKELGSDVLVIASDASDAAAQKEVAEAVRRAFQGLDILFLNAGIAELKPVEQWDLESFDRTFAIHMKGPYFLFQALLPVFANPASILLNASVNAHIGMPNTSVYGASKAAPLSLARTLSGELISRGIRVNAVSPGPISTPLYGKLGCLRPISKRWPLPFKAKCPRDASGNPARLLAPLSFSPLTNPRSPWAANSWLTAG